MTTETSTALTELKTPSFTRAFVGFLVNGSTVRTASLDGGPTQTLSDSINSTGGDWGSDGYIYVEGDSGLLRIPNPQLELHPHLAHHRIKIIAVDCVRPGAPARHRLRNPP